jgi:hypothetical protein
MFEVIEQEVMEQGKQRMKGLKWGVLIGSVTMVLAVLGPRLYDLLSPPSWPSIITVFAPLWCGGVIIAGIVAGAITRGSIWINFSAGALCAIPATVVCILYTVMGFPHIGDDIINPVMFLIMLGLGGIGGLISYGIQSHKRLAK